MKTSRTNCSFSFKTIIVNSGGPFESFELNIVYKFSNQRDVNVLRQNEDARNFGSCTFIVSNSYFESKTIFVMHILIWSYFTREISPSVLYLNVLQNSWKVCLFVLYPCKNDNLYLAQVNWTIIYANSTVRHLLDCPSSRGKNLSVRNLIGKVIKIEVEGSRAVLCFIFGKLPSQ